MRNIAKFTKLYVKITYFYCHYLGISEVLFVDISLKVHKLASNYKGNYESCTPVIEYPLFMYTIEVKIVLNT